MPRGRSFFGFGARWLGHAGRPYWGFGGWGGNPYPFCRNFPWLPRWWWASPYASYHASTVPIYWGGQGTAYPYAGWPGPFGATVPTTEAQDPDYLTNQGEVLKQQLDAVNKRLKELQADKNK